MKAKTSSILISCLFMFIAFGAVAGEKVLLTNGEWAPFQSENLPGYGAASRVMTAAFSAVDIEVKYGFFPWNRAMELVRQGLWDGTFMWVLTPERKKDFLVSDPLFTVQEVVFYSLAKPIVATRPEEMEGKVMGALDSSAFGTKFKDLIEAGKITVVRAHTNQQLFQMLSNGRVDFVPELETSGADAIREFLTPQQQQQISSLKTIYHPWSYHLLISRLSEKGPHFLDSFNKGLTLIKENGKFESILGSYIRPKSKN